MSSAPKPEEIARDAAWLAQALDPAAGVVRLIAMDRDSYRAASFLDDRMLQQPIDAQLVPWPEVEAAMADDLRSDARWIFHIGHVGSTLVSRLLGELGNVLALREPRLLRDVALCPPEVRERYLPPVAKLMSRTFASEEVALVKATSFVSEIAAELVPAGEAALLMYATPRNYIASILAGENSTKELHALAPTRAQRLARRITAIRTPHNDAELAAIGWACEMSALETAADKMSDRHVGWLDFDRMLVDVPAALATSAELLQIPAEADELETIATGPLTTRYSKALEYDYSPALRRDLIADATRRFAPEVDGALAMLRSAAEKSPLLARSLARCGED